MKFTAAGDAIIQRRIQSDFEGYEELAPFIQRGDGRFFNLETTLNYEGDCFASQFSGGTYIRTNPEVLDDLKEFGFNMTSFNNNHAMDFSYEGLLDTIDYVDESGLVHSGVGRNLDEASAPKYLETKNGRVALISVNSTFNPAMMAGVQARRVKGRPGINGLRVESKFTVSKEEMEFIKLLAKKTNVNASNEIIRAEGYLAELPEDQAEFGALKFSVGEKTEEIKYINEADVERVIKSIEAASFSADYVMVSVHSHQLSGNRKESPSQFLQDFAHRCIDAGAHAIVGHGPHLLRPIEIYKECPIFYSLGDFILELYNVELAPEDFYDKYGMNSQSSAYELLKKRSKNFTVGLMEDRRMFTSVIPYWETKDGKLTKLELMPIEMKMDGNKSENGLPRKATDIDYFDAFIKDCADFGTKIEKKADEFWKLFFNNGERK